MKYFQHYKHECKNCGVLFVGSQKQRYCTHKCRKDKQRNLSKKHQRILEYDKLLESQGGACAICKCAPSTKRFNVDHDHKTGKIRGLLCTHCNLALGFVRDDTRVLTGLIKYLSEELN